MPNMKPIIESNGVKLFCPIDGRYAFYNSPFPAHISNTAVDIYPSGGFGGIAPSPIDGRVVCIRRVKAPKGNGFTASEHDTVILIKNDSNPETITKMLHIEPLVEVGDKINVGEPIGLTLRSGYYGWGTSPHIHVEIRSHLDPIRARGGYNLDLIEVPKEEPTDKIAGTVVHLQPEFALIKLNSNRTGLVGTVNGKPAILDGGIPYYGWLGAHLLDAPDFGTIELLGEPIADITKCFSQSSIAICRHFHFAIDDIPILGLSLTLWSCLEPFVKAIPLDKGKLGLELGEYVKIELIIS